MKILFIQGGSRVRVCSNDTFYVDSNFNNKIWERYKKYGDELIVILRKIDKTFNEENIKDNFNKIDLKLVDLKLVDDLYSPRYNFFNIKKRRRTKKRIKNEILSSDKVIIRSIGNFYANTALEYCKKYKKDYLIEVTGFKFEEFWNHGFLGKIKAIPAEIKSKMTMANAPYVVYVTEDALQKRYPCKNKTLGCSDVVVMPITEQELIEKNKKKIKKFSDSDSKIKLGTAAFLDYKLKRQKDVIKAIYQLKKMGINKFEYELIGSGEGKHLKKLINKYGLEDCVKILGALNHDEVNNWLDSIDIYIHPSHQEGLCRIIVEAMSRGCVVICANTGGNYELIEQKCIYSKNKLNSLIEKILSIGKENFEEISIRNYNNSKKYSENVLNQKRDKFYKEFIEN
jgi:glycosyltransferase involved in cell wall biosynthesis